MNHKISVVTGTYNHSVSLPRLMVSMMNHPPHEWIICDDGSDDGTWELITEYSKRFSWVQGFSQTHKGMRLSRNLNNGFRHVTGDLIFVAMGDSYLLPDTLDTIDQAFIYGSAGCGVRINVNGDGTFHSYDWRVPDGNDKTIKAETVTQMTGNSMLVATKDLKDIGYWDEGYEGYGRDDWDAFGRLKAIGIPLYMFNKVKINHIYHGPGQEDNPESIKLYNSKFS